MAGFVSGAMAFPATGIFRRTIGHITVMAGRIGITHIMVRTIVGITGSTCRNRSSDYHLAATAPASGFCRPACRR